MSFFLGIKDFFSEMVTPKTSLRFKWMRFFSRFPSFRNSIKVNGQGIGQVSAMESELCGNIVFKKNIDEIVQELRRDGYSNSLELSGLTLDSLIDFCDREGFIPDRFKEQKVPIGYKDAKPPLASSIYSIANPHLKSACVSNIVDHIGLRKVAESYLKSRPVLINSQIWYTFPQDANKNHHNFGFHYDIDDYRFVKFFFYLDEVTDQHGPHVIIRGTHLEGGIFKFFNRRISTETAVKRYPDSIVVMTGGKGSGFAEDTYCYHKGEYPNARRLILQVEFGITERES